jgi:parallel beta-helix repeat protein
MAFWPDTRRGVRPSDVAFLAAAIVAVLALTGGEARASHVSCGDTITADTTLDGDLVDCPNNGIVIGVDDITLDLNGHQIDGDGTEFAACPTDGICDVGVVNDGHDGIRVRDGATREFGVGVLVLRARDNEVLGISSSRNVFFGAVVSGSARSAVRDSSLSRNIAPDGDGIGLFGSDHIRIVGNSIRDNPGPGIHVEDSTDNLIRRNVLARNGPSILIEADGNEVRRNRVSRGGGILVARGDRNVIVGNRVSRALDSIAIENGSDNLAARNVVLDARRTGIRLGIGSPSFGGDHNIVRRNLVRRSAEDGFHVYVKDGHSLVRRNIAVGAGDDGLEIESRSTKLTSNRAVRNADLGIRAIEGVIDGGGNRASGNGDPRQCVNVRCR